VKVALALYIETVMMGKDKKTQFDMKTLGIVDDFEVFANYDWSSVLFKKADNPSTPHTIASKDMCLHSRYDLVQFILQLYFLI